MSYTCYFYPHSAEQFAGILKSDGQEVRDRIVRWSKRKVSKKQLEIGLPLVTDFAKPSVKWTVDHFHVLRWIASSHLETVVISELESLPRFSLLQQVGFMEPMSRLAPYPLPEIKDEPLFAGFFPCSTSSEFRFDDPLIRNRLAIESLVNEAGAAMDSFSKQLTGAGVKRTPSAGFADEQEVAYLRQLILDLMESVREEGLDLLTVVCD